MLFWRQHCIDIIKNDLTEKGIGVAPESKVEYKSKVWTKSLVFVESKTDLESIVKRKKNKQSKLTFLVNC